MLLVLQLRKMLDLLVHASQCRSPQCQYPNCRKVKGLFRHGIQCKVRASGGCVLCKKMWYLLQLHARACKESQCHVPRCRFVYPLLSFTSPLTRSRGGQIDRLDNGSVFYYMGPYETVSSQTLFVYTIKTYEYNNTIILNNILNL